MSRCVPLFPFIVAVVVVTGCRHHRSQLLDPVLADDTLARETLAALEETPLQTPRKSRITLESRGQVWVYTAEFGIEPPDQFTARLASTLGGVALVASWDSGGEQLDGEPSGIGGKAAGLPAVLGLWLLGDCAEGAVLEGANGLAVDCGARGPDPTLTWRIWFDAERTLRLRGELLDGDHLVADYTCDPAGRCVLQDLLRGVAVRIIPH